MSSAIELALEYADGMIAAATILAETKARMSGGSAAAGDPYGPTAAFATNRNQQGWMQHNAEQLSYFKDWSYVAIRPIATRIAHRPINVAIVSRQVARRARDHAMETKQHILKQSLPDCFKAIGDDLEPIPHHPLLKVLANPNDLMVGWSHSYCTAVSLQLTGKALWWSDWDEENQRETLWYVPCHWAQPRHTKKKLFDEWLITPPGAGSPFTVPGELMLFFSLPDPKDPLASWSPLQAQAKAVSTDEQLQSSQYHSFKNGIRPGVIIKAGRLPGMTPGTLSEERRHLTPQQRSQLITAIQLAYEGVIRHGFPAIVDGLIEDIVPWTNTPVEMDYQNSGSTTKDRVMQGYGVNPVIAGATGTNRAEAAVAEKIFVGNVINPLLTMMSQVLTARYAPRWATGKQELIVWYEEARARDDELTLREWSECGALGVVSLNEIRRNVLNLPAMQGNPLYDQPLLLLNNQLQLEAQAAKEPYEPLSGEPDNDLDEEGEQRQQRERRRNRLSAGRGGRKKSAAPKSDGKKTAASKKKSPPRRR